MRRRGVATAIIVLGVIALAGPVALAFGVLQADAEFSDSEVFGLNRLTAATVDISAGRATVPVETSTLAPGDRIAGQIDMTNAGDVDLRYSLASQTNPTSSTALTSALRWELWVPDTSCDASVRPTLLFEGTIVDGALFGDATPGPDAGDRQLAPDENELICVEASLPLSSPNALQGLRASFVFVAEAEQVVGADDE